MPPARDDEEHADDGEVEEHEKQNQVKRHEDAEADALQEQEQAYITLQPASLAKRVDRDRQEHSRGQAEKRQGKSVDPHVVADPRAGDPRDLLRPAEPAMRLVADPGRDD